MRQAARARRAAEAVNEVIETGKALVTEAKGLGASPLKLHCIVSRAVMVGLTLAGINLE
jgi:hypothetical protein